MTDDPLQRLIADEQALPVEGAAAALADAARARIGGVAAVVFYGSCLRDGVTADAIADLYLLTDSHAASGQSWLARLGNALLPPNVVFLECDGPDGTVRAKAAIMTLAQFEAANARDFHSYFWARFAQPTRLVWAQDENVRTRVAAAAATAVRTLARETHAGPPQDSPTFWTEGLRHTYGAELRAEGPDRPQRIYEANKDRYDSVFSSLSHEEIQWRATGGRKAARRWLGKALSVFRLAKGVFTFDGGLDYILWKIARHSGVQVEAKPWQRRWPLIAAPGLAWRIWRQGGFK